jgi:hypothetical protein
MSLLLLYCGMSLFLWGEGDLGIWSAGPLLVRWKISCSLFCMGDSLEMEMSHIWNINHYCILLLSPAVFMDTNDIHKEAGLWIILFDNTAVRLTFIKTL